VSRIHKKTFYLQFCMGTPEGHQKSVFNTPKANKTKIHMGSIRQSLQGQPKNIKKIIESPNQPIEIKKSQIKVCLVYFKSEQKAKIRMEATRRSLLAQPTILKKLSEHEIYQSGLKFFQKKYA
jgi:hypothetical protein